MSAIADLATLQANLLKPIQRPQALFSTLAAVAGRSSSLWKVGPLAGSSPAAAAVPDNTTAGGIIHVNGGSGQLWMPRMSVANNAAGTLLICDRLSHIGGLVGNTTSPQTAVTSALTRYTNGYGVMMGLEISSQIGVTGTTFTVSYTDAEAGSSKTSTAIGIGGTNNREAGRFFQIPLANQDSSSSGHNGVTAIASLTLALSTGTAGDIALVLYRPLFMLPIFGFQDPAIYDAIQTHGSNCPEIFDNACLFGIVFSNTSGTGIIMPTLTTIET